MDRKKLLDKLNILSAGLSGLSIIPAMQHFWFTGSEIIAFNDHIALSSPFKTDFVGGAPGKLLINLIKAYNGRDIELVEAKGRLKAKSSKSRASVECLPIDHLAFDMPKAGKKGLDIPVKKVREAFSHCMLSAGADTLTPSQYHFSIMMIPSDDKIDMYATDDVTLSYAEVKIKKKSGLKDSVMLPASFCQQLLKLTNDKSRLHLEIQNEYCLARFTVPDLKASKGEDQPESYDEVTLFGRLGDVVGSYDYERVLAKFYDPKLRKKMHKLPERLQSSIERACIFSGSRMDWDGTKFNVTEGRQLEVSTESDAGEMKDKVKLRGDQKEVSFTCEPRLVKRAFSRFDSDDLFLIRDDCMIFIKEKSIFMIAALR